MNKFCPRCGKEESKNNQLIGGLCRKCVPKNIHMLKEYRPLKLVVCSQCNSYLHKNKWNEPLSNQEAINLRKIIKKLLPERLKFAIGVDAKQITADPIISDTKGKKTFDTKVYLQGTIHGVESKEKHLLQVLKESPICNLCKRIKSSYYEAIIQIRPKDEKLLNFVKHDMDSNKNTYITKEESKKFGYDLYITSKSYLKNIIPKIKKKFDIEIKISKTLYGKKDGKEIYRITALMRLKEEHLQFKFS